MTQDKNSIIKADDLCLWYGPHQALHDVSIDIPEKSITALIGPSGCGKSTFLKTLNRMNDLIPGDINELVIKFAKRVAAKYGEIDYIYFDNAETVLGRGLARAFIVRPSWRTLWLFFAIRIL